jgi:response regulator RpfG family c-di-GMP phosphodiesterase
MPHSQEISSWRSECKRGSRRRPTNLFVDEMDIQRSYLEHVNSYLTKPVDLEQFKAAVLHATEY